jgi:RNA polymerase sigma-54 factor
MRPAQTQTLIMTPQLQQAIKMLQLSNLELTNFVDAEVQQNPLLERRERVVGEISKIKSLDPRPGLALDPPLAQPVVPDILMRAQPEGGWVVQLNAETLPRVLVNNEYYLRVREATRSKAEKDYLTGRLHAANWLVKSLHQRATTILKVAAEIVRQQDAFFRYGVASLRPLILRDIADAIGMHESTISRVISDKYMDTPRGLYELKYFLTSAIPTSGAAH